MKTPPITIQVHIANLDPTEAAFLKRVLQVFTDPQDETIRSGLLRGKLIPCADPARGARFITAPFQGPIHHHRHD